MISISVQILLLGHRLMEMAKCSSTEAQMLELKQSQLRWVLDSLGMNQEIES